MRGVAPHRVNDSTLTCRNCPTIPHLPTRRDYRAVEDPALRPRPAAAPPHGARRAAGRDAAVRVGAGTVSGYGVRRSKDAFDPKNAKTARPTGLASFVSMPSSVRRQEQAR